MRTRDEITSEARDLLDRADRVTIEISRGVVRVFAHVGDEKVPLSVKSVAVGAESGSMSGSRFVLADASTILWPVGGKVAPPQAGMVITGNVYVTVTSAAEPPPS